MRISHLPLLRIVGVLFGVGFLAVGAFGAREGLQSGGWASAPARIVISEPTGTGAHRSSLIVAEYRLGADVNQCGRVALGRDNRASDASLFPAGARTTVYYDRSQPGRCALIRGVSIASVVFLALGVVFLALGVYAHVLPARPPEKSA